jgi:hypothetical protein
MRLLSQPAMRMLFRVFALVVAAAVVGACSSGSGGGGGGGGGQSAQSGKPVVIWAVGDGPNPASNQLAMQVSDMILADKPADVLYLGDVYNNGTPDEFNQYYEPTYGRFASITYPTPGNHELGANPPLSGYDGYWTAKRPSVGSNDNNVYAADLGNGWRVLGLTSEFILENPPSASGDDEDATPHPQMSDVIAFLQKEQSTHKGTCYLPIMHRPRFSPGSHGNQVDLEPIYEQLNGHTALLVQGHEHEYFRLDLDKVTGANSKIPGAQSIVIGTGGDRTSQKIDATYPGLVASWVTAGTSSKTNPAYFGALRMVLSKGSATFEYKTLDGQVKDSGTVKCTPVTATG